MPDPITNSDDARPQAVPWYQSPVMKAQIVTAVMVLGAMAPKAATALGLTSETQISAVVEGVCAAVSFVSLFYGMVKRAKSPLQPLKVSKAAADAHNQSQGNTP